MQVDTRCINSTYHTFLTLTWHESQYMVDKFHQTSSLSLIWHASQYMVHELNQRYIANKSSGAMCVSREVGLALIPYPILPPSLISRAFSVDVKRLKEEEEGPTLTCHASRYKVHKLCQRYALNSHLACE